MPLRGETAQSAVKFGVVDLFAGPGGLAEGFSAVTDQNGHFPFKITLSVEMDKAAHSTLLLRAFLRQFEDGFPDEYYRFLQNGDQEPDWELLYPAQWEAAKHDALLLELGPKKNQSIISARISEIRREYGNGTILIGGPPCQAYSLIGRARNRGVVGYVPENDPRHTLYENYISILSELRPTAFVMENVRGILSSSLNQKRIFDLICRDLEAAGPGYKLLALNPQKGKTAGLFNSPPEPSDFVVCSEDFGVPQARHRVIVIGIRRDLADHLKSPMNGPLVAPRSERSTVRHVLERMPKLRSGLSHKDSPEKWMHAVKEAGGIVSQALGFLPPAERKVFRERIGECTDFAVRNSRKNWPRSALLPARVGPKCPKDLSEWLLDSKLGVLPNNETRGHIPSDLARYLFVALYGELVELSPKAKDFPEALYPNHRSWESGDFADRFRVQLWDQPSTTVTSHIAKDGHYFIHPDPVQCRLLAVRQAA
jgi:DNA (cytosine-5)-methyltransferase 1